MNPTDFPLRRTGQNLVDLVLLDHLVDWSQPSEVEKLMFGVGQADYDRLLDEVKACPILAKIRWGGGATLLDVAMRDNQNELGACLVEHGADVNVYRELTGLPIHSAIESGNLEGVRLLVANGSRLDIPNHHESTPMHCAAISGEAAIVQLLLDGGARIDPHEEDYLTPLECAAKWRRWDVVKLLVENGATTADPECLAFIDEVMKH
jgi:ankyrin repeat protein